MWNRLIEILFALAHPACWLSQGRYSAEWDKELNRLLECDRFIKIDKFNATIGSVRVWIANHPYASFVMEGMNVRPKRMTVYKAHKKLVREYFEQRREAE